MIRLLWAISPIIRDFLARWMPTNRLLAAIRTPHGLKWGIPAILLGVAYWLVAAVLATVVRDGGSGWLNILVSLFIWNGLKFLWVGPVSVVLLMRLRLCGLNKQRRLIASQ